MKIGQPNRIRTCISLRPRQVGYQITLRAEMEMESYQPGIVRLRAIHDGRHRLLRSIRRNPSPNFWRAVRVSIPRLPAYEAEALAVELTAQDLVRVA